MPRRVSSRRTKAQVSTRRPIRPRRGQTARSPARPSPAPSPRVSSALTEEPYTLPTSYGEDRLVLMVRDPWWLYAYWEIRPDTERAVRQQLQPDEVAGLQSVLRVAEITGRTQSGDTPHRTFDIRLSGMATNWYIQTNAPNRTFLAELGLLTKTGRFLPLARSNQVTTPPDGPSAVVDEQWAAPDAVYAQLLSMAGGLGADPTAWWQLSQQMLASHSSSWGLAGPHRPGAVRHLWVRVSADLVLYGMTEPKAKVTIQGQPVVVQKDGTFHIGRRGTLTPINIAEPLLDMLAYQGRPPAVTLPGAPRAGDAPSTSGRLPQGRAR